MSDTLESFLVISLVVIWFTIGYVYGYARGRSEP